MHALAYRNIVLWRHAEALPLNKQLASDLDRPLSKKGQEQAKKVATWLNSHLPNNTIILSSTALRAKQTTQTFSSDFITMDSLNPGASLKTVIETLNHLSTNQDDPSKLLLIGHQPWLGMLAEHLLHVNKLDPTDADGLNIKKGAAWWFKQSTTDQAFDLFSLQTPSLL